MTAPQVTYNDQGRLVVIFAPEHEAVLASRDTLARISLCERVEEQRVVAMAEYLCRSQAVG